MRAIRFERFGDPSEVLKLVDVPTPRPSANEALIEVRAAALNPSDAKNVSGAFSKTILPRTPGRDFAGVVVEGPTEWKGAAVWGSSGELGFTRDGAHAEALLLPVQALSRKPERLSFAEAAASGTPFVTAAVGLRRAGLSRTDVVLIGGAAGGVGSAAVQIARSHGATVCGLVNTDAQEQQALSFGAHAVIRSRDKDLVQALQAALKERLITLAIDTPGVLLDPIVRVLAHRGRVVAISAPPDGLTTFHLREFYRREATLFGVDTLKLDTAEASAILRELAPAFESGALRPPQVKATFPLEDAKAAYAAVKTGKVVLLPTKEPGRS